MISKGVAAVGFVKKRVGVNGKPRYTAVYLDARGSERSAGTFPTKEAANAAWKAAEVKLSEGRIGDPARGRQTFESYVTREWLPNHVIEVTTREGYTGQIRKHIMPWFGPMKMNEILPWNVREWIAALQRQGVTPANIRALRSILSGIFTTALNDQVTFLHPCKGVKIPTVPKKPLTIISPEQFDTLYAALPDADTRMLIETSIDSGMRWGELTELRVKDLDLGSGIVTVSRAVAYVSAKYHPEGKHFLVKEYPKDREFRRFKLSPDVVARLANHIKTHALGHDDLLFTYEPKHKPRLTVVEDPEDLGLTEPNEAGRTYRHGTMSAYNAAKCRCDHCRAACARYRAERRAQGKDNPRPPRVVDTDGHISRNWFYYQIWRPALKKAKIDIKVRIQDLRHAHASWLLAGGADLQVVKERLGHGSIRTTENHLHTLPDADTTALDALARVRQRKSTSSG